MLSTQQIDPSNPGKRRAAPLRWITAAWHWLLPPSVAHSDRESETKRTVRIIAFVVLCLAMVGGALRYARPLGKSYHRWQADRAITAARGLAEKGDLANAIYAAQRAHGVAPEYEPSLRLNAELLTAARVGAALHYWNELEKRGSLSLDDKRGKVLALLRSGQQRDARNLWEQLVRENPSDKNVLALADEVIGKQRGSDIVVDVLKKFVSENPADRDTSLRLATLQLQSGTPAEISAGIPLLIQLSKGDDDVALASLRMLSEREKIEPSERERLARGLDAHPKATGWDHTTALSLRVAMSPESRDRLINETQKSWFTDRTGAELEPFVRWLVLSHEFGRVLPLVDLEEIKKRQDCRGLLMNYLTAVTMLGRIDLLENIVEDTEIPLSRGVRSFSQAHLGLIKGLGGDELKGRLRTAVSALVDEGQHDLLLQIGSYCLDKLDRYYDVARSAYEAVARAAQRRTSRQGFAGWLRSCRLAGDTAGYKDAAELANRVWPDNSDFQLDKLYASMLMGEQLELAASQATRMLEASPDDDARKLVAAMGHWRLGDIENAVASCQNLSLRNIANDRTGQTVVFPMIILDAGPQMVSSGSDSEFRLALARSLAHLKNPRPMLPEEQNMLDRARTALALLNAQAAR